MYPGPMECGALGFREPGTGTRYTNTDLLRFTFLRFVRLSPGHPAAWNGKSLWEGQVLKLGGDILVPYCSVSGEPFIVDDVMCPLL